MSNPQGASTVLKVIAPFRFIDDQPKDASLAHWNEKHPEVVRRCIPTAERYVQNVPIRISDRTWSFDGISELWFPDMEALKQGFADQELQKELHADEDRFAKRENLWVIASEIEVW
jgi:hypothetical protein